MPRQPPPSPPNRSIWAYALPAAVVWALVAYDLVAPKPAPQVWKLAGEEVPRLMLHALALEFPHPDGGIKRIEAEPPSDFQRLSEALFG